MNATSNARVLRIALAASLALHLLVASVIHSRPVTAAPEQNIGKTEIIKIRIPKPTPTPTPTPPVRKKRVTPKHRPVSRAIRPPMHIVRVPSNPRNAGPAMPPLPTEPTGEPVPVDSAGPDVAPTGAPTSATTPTPKPACSAPDIPAKTTDVVQPTVPDDAQSSGFVGTAKVRVDLDASGSVVGAAIYESTGSLQLDRAALEAAHESRYAPEERDCKNVAGSYLFVIDFQ